MRRRFVKPFVGHLHSYSEAARGEAKKTRDRRESLDWGLYVGLSGATPLGEVDRFCGRHERDQRT